MTQSDDQYWVAQYQLRGEITAQEQVKITRDDGAGLSVIGYQHGVLTLFAERVGPRFEDIALGVTHHLLHLPTVCALVAEGRLTPISLIVSSSSRVAATAP